MPKTIEELEQMSHNETVPQIKMRGITVGDTIFLISLIMMLILSIHILHQINTVDYLQVISK